MQALTFFPMEKPEIARARAYPPERDFLAWWELVKTHVYHHVDIDGSARSAAVHVAEKVKEAEKGPAGRRVTIIEAQWWFCKEVSLSLYKQGAGNVRFHEVVLMPEPHRRMPQFATLYRLERAQGFEKADDVAGVLAAGWGVTPALGAGPQDDQAVMRLAPDDGAGGLTARELRDVVENLVAPAVDLTLGRLEHAVQQGLQPPDRLVRERDAMHSLLYQRRTVPDDLAAAAASPGAEAGQARPYFESDNLISFCGSLITLDEDDGAGDAFPAPFRQAQGLEPQPTGSWETWDD